MVNTRLFAWIIFTLKADGAQYAINFINLYGIFRFAKAINKPTASNKTVGELYVNNSPPRIIQAKYLAYYVNNILGCNCKSHTDKKYNHPISGLMFGNETITRPF